VLAEADVRAVADVRAFPSSRRHPQFNAGSLSVWLPSAGIRYVHVPELGGRRRPQQGSVNGGWREPAFQGYADHMASDEFARGLARVMDIARERPTAIMCAEAVWWRCHRRLIADALTVRGWEVVHLVPAHPAGTRPTIHELSAFAVVSSDGQLSYPPSQSSLFSEQARSDSADVD
jgi:uncharacterized protein (DUF488 family)